MEINPFEKLSAAFALCVGDQLMPGVGTYPLGAVASVMPTKDSGKSFIDEYYEGICSMGMGEPSIVPVGDPWKFMQRAAGEGLAGIEGANAKLFPDRFMFMVRVDEAGSNLPTVLTSIINDSWDSSLTRFGCRDLSHVDLLHWERYDILDKVSGRWGLQCPFRDWNHGDALYELTSDHAVVQLAEVQIIGDWISPDGAWAFFTSEEGARHFLEHHLGNDQNRMLLISDYAPNDPQELMDSLEPRAVQDLKARLTELYEFSPLASWCVNPDHHREDSGYGRFLFGNELPATWSPSDPSALPKMVSVAGHWLVQENNVFEIQEELAPWTGADTIRWSGGSSIQLLKLDRTMADVRLPIDVNTSELSDVEAEELVDLYLTVQKDFPELLSKRLSDVPTGDDRISSFYIDAWDAVTGDYPDAPYRFDTVFEALKFLMSFEHFHDRMHRVHGAKSCSHIGICGTGNADFEDLSGQRFQQGIKRLALRILKHGYKPSDAEDIVVLCNRMLRTLHVQFAGFAKDLFIASPGEQQKELCQRIAIEESSLNSWYESSELKIDPRGRNLALERISKDQWERLCDRSKFFVSTALLQLEQQGYSPQLDYAPISLEVVKSLEVELARLVDEFFETLEGKWPQHDETRSHESACFRYFDQRGNAPTIGAFKYLFKIPQKGDSFFAKSLHQFLKNHSNYDFLTDKKFYRKGLDRVVFSFRNGGVHDSPISFETCQECVTAIIGTKESPGYLVSLRKLNETSGVGNAKYV